VLRGHLDNLIFSDFFTGQRSKRNAGLASSFAQLLRIRIAGAAFDSAIPSKSAGMSIRWRATISASSSIRAARAAVCVRVIAGAAFDLFDYPPA